jgi:murein DD-endopeptidase MepM/ murein hydrolase activator NlpD
LVQIIVLDKRLARTVTLTLTPRKLWVASAAALLVFMFSVTGFSVATLKIISEFRIPYLHEFAASVLRDEVARNEQFVRDNVSAMARKLGEMQAQLMRLDALGERVSRLSGIRPEEFNFKELPGRGGPEARGRPLTVNELKSELDRVARGVESRADYMDVVESELMKARARRALLPENTPVPEGFVGSGYGMRVDPFTGQMAMHAGLDFAAPAGTPILAAAGGVVVNAGSHPEFGNMVEIDHGNHLSTLYAHARRLFVKTGDIVREGQKVAEVGTTGRSTGPHLHFEVHVNGAAQNPMRFLASRTTEAKLARFGLEPPPRSEAPAGDLRRLAALTAATRR